MTSPKEFKLIVAGGRDFSDNELLSNKLIDFANSKGDNEAVAIVSGMARGADEIAYKFAKHNDIKCYEFPANWDKYGKRAGFMRNTEMAHFADGLLAFWDGQSRGTRHMIETMQILGKEVQIIYY